MISRGAIERELTAEEIAVIHDWARTLALPDWRHLPALSPILSSIAVARRVSRAQHEHGLAKRAALEYACAPLGVRPRSHARRLLRWLEKSW
jgi:hypothetical protein